jgi:caffeoyl-CoA O-methyltransferase
MYQNQQLDQYVNKHTKQSSYMLQELACITKTSMFGSNMLSGHLVGRLLKLLVMISNSQTILEIGTYTGYATLSMAEALDNNGKIITCELDPNTAKIAAKFFAATPHNHKITLLTGPALTSLEKINTTLDLVFIDADKNNYQNYYNLVLPKVKSSGLIVIDNALWGGEVLDPQSKQATVIDKLNKQILADNTVENILLNIRDGINLVYKK